MSKWLRGAVLALVASASLVACEVGERDSLYPTLQCDALVPEICGLPYPNNVFTRSDESSPTGRRLALDPALVPGELLADAFNRADGFSPGIGLTTYLRGATEIGLNGPDDIPASLGSESRSILINVDTGERVPHWVELDRSANSGDDRSLIVRPALRLRDATRYIVALRGIVGADGRVINPGIGFRALRDGLNTDDSGIGARRDLYDDIFAQLESKNVPREDLQIAWDFTTASRANNTDWMLAMRDEALANMPATGPVYAIDSIDTDYDPENIAFRIKGTFEVPLYLTDPNSGGELIFGEDGLPTQNTSTPTTSVEFEALIPQSALTQPAPLLQYGHGLLGSHTQIESEHFRTFINEYNYIFFAVDLAGMAEEDATWIAGQLATRQLNLLTRMHDRMHQGVLNNLMAMELMQHGLANDPMFAAYIDGTRRYYHGISQGGIFGGVYMALSTSVTRGALGVPGQSYNLLLHRSVDFDPFFAVMRSAFPDAREQNLALALLQGTWDRVEPNGYTDSLGGKPLRGTPAKQVLLRAAVGDHQVSTLGAHMMARAIAADHVSTGIRDIWGLKQVISSRGNAYVEYDFGLPPEPLCNVPQRACGDPHGKLRKLEEARQQLHQFLSTGEVKNTCNGACRFNAQSGCDESPPPPTDACAFQ